VRRSFRGLGSQALSEPFTEARWAKLVRGYRREMKQPGAERLLKLLALFRRGGRRGKQDRQQDQVGKPASLLSQAPPPALG